MPMQNLYTNYKDNCGFGLVASIDNKATHKNVEDALTALSRMMHRGAIAADGKSGDGSGLLFSLPKKLFNEPTSTVITSAEGSLLGAKIASDMQWRFPEKDTVPTKFAQCVVHYEDAYFYKHWGFNPVSIFKAFVANRKAGKIIRGGSTLTQQVIRLSRNNKKRTYWEKIKELVLATRLEFRYSKRKILALYASHAPFGGNVVGLEAASWRYFGREPNNLSWAEAATLAVLPNAPGLIYINKNRKALVKKRNRLLTKLFNASIFSFFGLNCNRKSLLYTRNKHVIRQFKSNFR